MKKKYITIILWTAFLLLNTILIKNIISQESNLDNYFRLHVVANSNSVKDQAIKMNVANDISKKISDIVKNANSNSKNDIKNAIEYNVKDILVATKFSLEKQNDYKNVSIKIGNIYYDEKINDNMIMDEGVYDSMQIIIGEGKGKNFWSLIYPYSYAGMYEINTDISDINNNLRDTDFEGNTILSTDDIISNTNVEYKSGILEFAKKMWFN